MSSKLTFIHSGDLHLGAPFRGLRALSPAWAQRLVRAIPEAYDCVIDACIQYRVDFLILAGDMFDNDKPSYAHFRHFIRGLERLEAENIPVYMVAGNHDPYANWTDIIPQLPANVRMMASDAPEFAVHRGSDGQPKALIAARGFTNYTNSGSPADGMTRADVQRATGETAPFAVGILHTGLWMDPLKAPVSEANLLAADMDYWALGHIHMRYATPQDDPHIAFCGCIQGRDIKETGSRGCYKVTLEEGMPNQLEFIPTAQVEWEQLCVDVAGCAGIDDILAACVKAMFEANASSQCEEMVVRVTLGGPTPLYDVLARPGIIEEILAELNESCPTFYCDALVNMTTPPFDKEAFVSAGLFPATLLRCAQDMCATGQQEDEEAEGGLMDEDDVDDFEVLGKHVAPTKDESAPAVRKTLRDDSRLKYLQEEFARRGLTLPHAVEHSLDDLTESACDMTLALLDGRDA